MFVDRIRVFAQAGNGGRGCVSFRREKFVPKGGPDGGDGGRGGDIILQADVHVDNLSNLYYEPIIKAKSGGHGMGKKMHGRSAPNKIVKVPVGTVIYQAEEPVRKLQDWEVAEEEERKRRVRVGESQQSKNRALTGTTSGSVTPNAEHRTLNDRESEEDGQHPTLNAQRPTFNEGEEEPSTVRPALAGHAALESRPLADLTAAGQEFLLAKGGKGGKGNVHFKSSRNRAPREYTEGDEGEHGHFLLELRTMADAGLVGYPNAGKSTLLRKVSAARPKVAPYPFTTLHPIIGVADFSGYRRATVADIPGLIEGAHRNVGLGHDFLRHITRCQILLFVVDTAGSEGRDPVEDLQQLRKEIDLYDKRLSQRPWFIVANKMDLPDAEENLRTVRRRFPKIEIVAVSAAKGDGIDELKRKLGQWLESDARAEAGQAK